jgi:predicted nucleic acid-binding Zn ribbon protein
MNRNRFSRIGDILPAVLKSVGLDKKLKERELLSLWPTVVGEEIAARTRAVRVDRGVLYVQVSHSAWLQELHFMEKEIFRKLRETAPDIEFHRIRFETGQ